MINRYGSRSSTSRGYSKYITRREAFRYFGGAACDVRQAVTEAARCARVIERALWLDSARQIGSVRVSWIAFVCREPDTASRPPTFVRRTNSLEILTFTRGSLESKSHCVAWSACRIFLFLVFLFFHAQVPRHVRRANNHSRFASRERNSAISFLKNPKIFFLFFFSSSRATGLHVSAAYRLFRCLSSTCPMHLYKRNELCIRESHRAYDVYLLDERATTLHRA